MPGHPTFENVPTPMQATFPVNMHGHLIIIHHHLPIHIFHVNICKKEKAEIVFMVFIVFIYVHHKCQYLALDPGDVQRSTYTQILHIHIHTYISSAREGSLFHYRIVFGKK